MTRLEAEALASQNGGLRLLPRSLESQAAARAVLLECVAGFSPRIEEVSDYVARDASTGTACAFVLGIARTERCFDRPRTGRAVAQRAQSRGLSRFHRGQRQLSCGSHDGGSVAQHHRDSRRRGSAGSRQPYHYAARHTGQSRRNTRHMGHSHAGRACRAAGGGRDRASRPGSIHLAQTGSGRARACLSADRG